MRSNSRYWIRRKKIVEKVINDYEYIEGELYIRAKSIAKAILGSPNFTDDGEDEFLEQDLGINKKGHRI